MKRKPLLSAENSPKKPKNESQKARHDKLARLAQNIRAMDAADRGDSISAADLVKTSPNGQSNDSPNRRRSREQMENTGSKENSKPKKNSKWARLAQEREGWDNDFQSSNQITEKEDRIVVAPKTPVKSRQPAHQSPKKTQENPKKQLHPSGSARDMVAEALARAGKGHQANTRRIEPKSNKPNARIEGKFGVFHFISHIYPLSVYFIS